MNTDILLLCDRKSAAGDSQIRPRSGLTSPAGPPVQMSRATQDVLEGLGHTVNTVILNRDEIKPCLGCFGCWLRTPGNCVITDDAANDIASLKINARAVVLLSEITYGGFSSDIKAFLDRSIQNILPFFEMYKGEMHHQTRYERFPVWITVGYGDAGEAEKHTFTRLADRNALNFRPESYVSLIARNMDELSAQSDSIRKTLEVGA